MYKKFGYTTPRVSRDQAKKYKKISVKDLKPGDLVFYGRVKDNYIKDIIYEPYTISNNLDNNQNKTKMLIKILSKN